MIRRLTALLVLILISEPVAAQQLPAAPAPAAIELSGAQTALLVLDVIEPICGAQPNCQAMLPRVTALLVASRRAGVYVIHSAASGRSMLAPTTQPPFLGAVAPLEGEPVVLGGGQDRFYGTLLDQLLRKRGITTLILAGWRVNGSLLYTAVGANLRAYTVVVADDATSAAHDYDIAVGHYQLLTQLNANPKNEPLLRGAVTISRSDLITFR